MSDTGNGEAAPWKGAAGYDLDSVRSRHRVDRVVQGREKPRWMRWLAVVLMGLPLLALAD